MMLAQNLDNIQSRAGLGGVPRDVGGVISNAIPYVFGISGFLLLIYMISGGLQLMTSRGDPKAVQTAQGKITNALLGFVIVLVSAGLVVLLGRILGIDVFSGIF